ncbi:hypothetical protein S245_047520, partial [Arachis hypogaea]
IAILFPTHLEDGVRKVSRLSVKEAITLPSNTKIVLPFNKELQPIGQVAGLFSGFLGSLGADYSQFPIYAESWKHVNKAKKEHAYDMIKVRHGNCGLVELVEVQQQLVARTPVFYRLEQMDGGAILVG